MTGTTFALEAPWKGSVGKPCEVVRTQPKLQEAPGRHRPVARKTPPVTVLIKKTFTPEVLHFSYEEADTVARMVAEGGTVQNVIDLRNAFETTTAAFARLIRLRLELVQVGRDLVVSGLRDRTRGLYEINKLDKLLPLEA